MSKSQPNTCLFLDDSPAEIKEKVKRAVTDSGSEVKYDREKKPSISNLITIYSSLLGESISRIEKKFARKNYLEFKVALAKLIADHFAAYREKKKDLLKNSALLKQTLRQGAGRAAKIAARKITDVKKKIGLTL